MKTIKNLIYENVMLSVLIEENDKQEATATYFINGFEAKEWSKIRPEFQDLLSAIFERFCKDNKLKMWSY